MDEQKRRTWAEISLARLGENYRYLRSLTEKNCKFMGMVKSDAYGHGAVAVGRKLEELGAEYLGVAYIDEAIELRKAGIKTPILLLGMTDVEDTALLLDYKLTQTVFDLAMGMAYGEKARELGDTLSIHIKIDSGMTRLGFLGSDEEMLEGIAAICQHPNINPEGIFTHFAYADGDDAYTKKQFSHFMAIIEKLENLGQKFAIRHCANSAATLFYPETHLDMIRPGIALYGHHPEPSLGGDFSLLPVMGVKSRVYALRWVSKGTAVSYGCTKVLERDTKLAVVPIGYGDGFSRQFSNRFSFTIRGKSCPIIGRVCMDMCMVDVTELEELSVGDEVIVYSDDKSSKQSVEEGAKILGTISYELLCDLSKRIHRTYD